MKKIKGVKSSILKPLHTIVMSCWRFTDIHNTKYIQHDIPLLCCVGGLLTYTTQYTSNTTYHYGLSCWRFTDIPNTKYLQHDIPFYTSNMSCWRFTDIRQHNIPPTRHTILHLQHVVLEVYRHAPTQYTSNTTYRFGVSCWRFTVIHNTKYFQHDIPLLCRVGSLPTYTTQNTSNTTYHWCVVYVVTFRPS